MIAKNSSVIGGRALVLPVVLAAVLAGCAPARVDTVCRTDCKLEITLPEDERLPPSVSPEQLVVAGGIDLEVFVHGAPDSAETVLLFRRKSPFASRNRGRPLPVVLLKAGVNTVKIRPYGEGVCRKWSRCKYEIENVGNPERPALDPWIIIER